MISTSASSWSPLRTHSRASGSSSTIKVRIFIPHLLRFFATSQWLIRKETQGVTVYAELENTNIPDERFKNRKGAALSPTGDMSLRTKAAFRGTGRRAPPGGAGVRPAEYFFGVAAVVALMVPGRGCGTETPAAAAQATPVAVAASPTATPAPDLFVTSVRPMLAQKCAPCHEPGGKLYEKLPFDNRTVVADHVPGMMKRLKGEDRAILEAWVATLPSSRCRRGGRKRRALPGVRYAAGASPPATPQSHSVTEAGGNRLRHARLQIRISTSAYVPSNSTFQVFPPSADDSQSWRTLASACGVHVMR